MKYIIFILAIGILELEIFFPSFSQGIQPLLLPGERPSEEVQIKLLLQQFMFSLRRGDISSIQQYLPNKYFASKVNKSAKRIFFKKEKISFENFTIKPHQIKIEGNSAYTICDITDGKNINLTSSLIKFERSKRGWIFIEIPEYLMNIEYQNNKSNNVSSVLILNDLITSDKALLSINHPNTNIQVLNATVTQQHLQLKLFANNSKIDADGLYINTNEANAVSFFLDPDWNRIVYLNKSGNWVKSYGDHLGNHEFFNPQAIAVEPLSYLQQDNSRVYVIDGNKIVRLVYYIYQGVLGYVSDVVIDGIEHLCDISLKLDGGFYNADNNRLWIADDRAGQIVETDMNCNVLRTIKYYTLDGQTYRLLRPRKILASEGYSFSWSNYIGVIDGARNSFVLIDPNSINNSTQTAIAIRSTEFLSNSYLTDIGQDDVDEWWITDEGLEMVHKFSWTGEYIVSTVGFSSPQRISKSPWLMYEDNNGIAHYGRAFYLYTADSWGNTTGMRTFLPGADIIKMNVNVQGSTVNAKFLPTNLSKIHAYIKKNSTGSIVETLIQSYDTTGAYLHNYFIDASQWTSDNYSLVIKVKPYFNGDYGVYQQDWVIREYPFFYQHPPIFPPLISNISQNPFPFFPYQNGEVICSLSQGNGNLQYHWISRNEPSGSTVTFNGKKAILHYGNNKLSSNHSFKAPTWELECYVTNQAGISQTIVYHPTFAGGNGCPFVYVWNGGTYIEDNNILPQSEFPENHGQDVTDYYQLYSSPVVEGETYKLAVAEFEQEHSWFDRFQLLAIDHSSDVSITIDDNGTIIQFAKPIYVASAELDSEEVIKEISTLDGVKVEAAKNDNLQLLFTQNGGQSYENGLLLVARLKPNSTKKNTAGEVTINGEEGQKTFSSFHLRRNPSFTWMMVPAADTSTLQINIQWKEDSEIDYTELSNKLELPFTVHSTQLLQAVHSDIGDIKNHLQNWDQDYAELNPGEWIDLEFNAPPLQEGMERSFIFVTRGRYEAVATQKILKPVINNKQDSSLRKTKLLQNTPNPFNPTTTIQFHLQKPSYVILKIYNLIGEEIATLVNDELLAGMHDTEWDATKFPSGIYIYRLQAGEFVETKKLVHLK